MSKNYNLNDKTPVSKWKLQSTYLDPQINATVGVYGRVDEAGAGAGAGAGAVEGAGAAAVVSAPAKSWFSTISDGFAAIAVLFVNAAQWIKDSVPVFHREQQAVLRSELLTAVATRTAASVSPAIDGAEETTRHRDGLIALRSSERGASPSL